MLSTSQFERLIPWFVNGTLSEPESAQVAAYLERHPEEQARLHRDAALRRAVVGLTYEVPRDVGLERILAAIRTDGPMQSGDAGHACGCDDGESTQAGLPPPAPPPQRQSAELPREDASAGSHGLMEKPLDRVKVGDKAARDALFERVCSELKKLAHMRLYQGGRAGALDTTALVNEVYIRLIQSAELRSEDRRSFFAFASKAMRSVIVDTARARLAERRGGGAADLTLSTQMLDQLACGEQAILDVHEAVLALEQADPRLARLVEMRYYGGYSESEIAQALGVTERKVQREWQKARLLLRAALGSR